MIVAIVGSRDFTNYCFLKKYLNSMFGSPCFNVHVISGGARGADTLAHRYAVERGWKFTEYPAKWKEYGKSAGYRRNEHMAKDADMVVLDEHMEVVVTIVAGQTVYQRAD